MKPFIDTAESRETSPEIMAAILTVARGETQAIGVWESPTPEELLAVWEIVTNNGLRDASDYVWGASGAAWAPQA